MYYQGVDREIEKIINEKAIYVLANGLDQIHSQIKNKKNSLFLSEYPEGIKLSKQRCKDRNRLTASFAKILILFSSLKDGPINHLITNFLNLGKEIYCFPGDGSKQDGNSELIKQGANLITSIKDINNCKNN
jgi:DNA processing protein